MFVVSFTASKAKKHKGTKKSQGVLNFSEDEKVQDQGNLNIMHVYIIKTYRALNVCWVQIFKTSKLRTVYKHCPLTDISCIPSNHKHVLPANQQNNSTMTAGCCCLLHTLHKCHMYKLLTLP